MQVELLSIIIGVAFAAFCVGFYGLISKPNGIKIIISIEILVASVNLVFIGFGFLAENGAVPMAQTMAILSLSIGGAVVGLSLAILKSIYNRYGTINMLQVNKLKY